MRCSFIMPLRSTLLTLFLAMTGMQAAARDTFTGDWDGLRPWLSEKGVDVQVTYSGSFTSHLSGGFRTGTDWQGLLDVALEFDLEKLAGWKNTLFHAEGLWVQGNDPSSEYIGNFDEVSGIAGVATIRPYQFWLQRQFYQDKLTLKAGWVTLDTDFMMSNGANLFTNASFGPPLQSWNGNFTAPVYPVAALGMFVEWKPDEKHELQLGLYDGDSGGERGNLHTSNTRTGSDDGVAILLEGAREHTVAGLPGTLKLGAGYNTGLTTVNATGNLIHGNGGAYLILDQTLLAGRGDKAPDRLAFFTRLGCDPWGDRSVVDHSIDAGLTGRGLRDVDTWGVAVTSTHFSPSYVSATFASGGFSTRRETAVEVTYKAQCTPWMALQPTFQYIMQPQDGTPDATVLGVLLTLTF